MSILHFSTAHITRVVFISVLSLTGIAHAAPDTSKVHEVVTQADLQRHIDSGNPVFIKFYLPTCPACKSYAPHFIEAAKKDTGAHFVQINGNDNRTDALRRKYKVNAFPTIIMISDGRTKRLERPVSGALAKMAKQEMAHKK